MEEEVGIKVTRLRRRLSVEAEDVKSPSTQSTPTKKRGGRLAAKPQLELIDENATEIGKPKRTRKSTVKDVEPEENPITPARRSTRIRSNTSIVSETPAEGEDKGTPSRRSTRIKSNTSIIAETVPYTDSPRAKRAARRTSQVGSDNEAPVTPARQTRRTRKDSTSSIDKTVEPSSGKLGTQVAEAIVEETENSVIETTNKETPTGQRKESPTVRKSPRLIKKTGRKSSSLDNDDKENEPESTISKSDEKQDIVDGTVISTSTKLDQSNELTGKNNLSVSSSNLIKDLDGEPKKGKTVLNKTTTEAELSPLKSKRHRRKSWTTVSSSPTNETIFLSDTETIKKKNKRKSHDLSNMVGSGDSVLNTSNKSVHENNDQNDLEEVTLHSSIASDKKKNKSHNKSLILETDTSIKELINSSKEDINSSQKHDQSFTEKFFGVAPTGAIQTLVYIEDSDSNTDSVEKVNVNKELDNEDQCVPVVEHHLAIIKEAKNNLSYEPMDIDETMPENVSLSVFTDKNASAKLEDKDAGLDKRKSVLNISQVTVENNLNKSQRKSTMLDLDNDNGDTLNISKRKSVIDTNNDTINKSMNKSKRRSTIATIDDDADMDGNSNSCKNQSTIEEPLNKSLNKSKKRSTSLNHVSNDEASINTPNPDKDDNINKSSNKAKNKSFVTNIDQDSTINTASNITNKSKRKSSISRIDVDFNLGNQSTITTVEPDDVMNESSSKSKRKSSVSNMKDEDNMDISINKSLNDNNMNKSSNKSKRKSSISNVDDNDGTVKDADKSESKSSVSNIVDTDEVDNSSNKSKLTVSIENIDDGIINRSSNKSKRKSTLTDTLNDNNIENIMSQRESTMIDNDNNGSISKNSDKHKRKSSISNINIDDNMDKSSNKSKRKSSISHMDSQTFDRSNNENKSTLVLSQIKDTSETNVPKDIYEFNESNDSNEQLSKSVNVPNVKKDKESDKKNLSLTYSTSTPLQQKSMKKLGMQINTSIIAPNSVTKIEKNSASNRSKKETSVLSQNDEESEPSDEEDGDDSEDEDEEGSESEENDSEEENEIMSKSKMIDDEAEEASDDYESGDSRDDSEREYEEQNEIREKGETLDSEDEEFSDDSNYEKGSFVVDSDEEDDELLSGSGDDLSINAEELSMSAKSKKKFNERKIKEQKKASREMFEARHKLNESDKSSKSDKHKSKKSNRQRLESSDSESDEEVDVQPKKSRRPRIDSSQDISVPQSDTDKSMSKKKKKKVKRLSESVCEDDASNEKEISVQESKDTEIVDPLSLQYIVKEEPKTPQKELDMSTVAITDIEEVEEVQVDENVSIRKLNQTSDPLQATVAQDESMEDDSDESISENEEITQNYESVLNELNKKSKKVKSLDISLNLNKKSKQKANEPIVDQLNLTQVRKSKKKKFESTENADPEMVNQVIDVSMNNKIGEKVNKSVNIQDEGSSDSIDMKLLFNEDSNDGEIKVNAKEAAEEIVTDFIPLKRTEGKTNILEKSDITSTTKDDSILNVSKSKKSKRKSSQPRETVTLNNEEDDNLGFFIDTVGTHTDMNKSATDTSIKDSAKKNNKAFATVEETKDGEDSNESPLEVSYHSEKNNKSKHDLNNTQTYNTKVNTTTSETPSQSGKKKKKKNKKSLDSSQIEIEEQLFANTDDVLEKSINTSILSITGSKKNKKLSESHVEQETENEEQAKLGPNTSTGSAKKQKSKFGLESSAAEKKIIVEGKDVTLVINKEKSKKRKRNPSSNPSFDEMITNDNAIVTKSPKSLNVSLLTTNEKKKRKISHNEEGSDLETKGAVPEIQQLAKEPDNPTGKKSNKKYKTANEQKPNENIEGTLEKNKKRKQRDDDDGDKLSKVIKQNSCDQVHVPRLPANILKQLDDEPKTDIRSKAKIISTTSFKVEETKRRRNKPSNYLEQSVYLNDSLEEETKQCSLKKPKVLPFIPTASTSNFGFTTNFKVNVIPQETQFVAQSNDISNFKKDYLLKNRIKKMGTFEMYKRHRNIKISKF